MSDLAGGEVSEFQKKVDKSRLQDDEQLRSFKKEFFNLIKIMLVVMFVIAYVFMLSASMNKPSTGATVIVVTSLMVPTVITLALVRFLYAKNSISEEKTAPSVGFNFLKEISKILKDYLSKKES